MYKTLHPKSDIDRLYLPQKVDGRGLLSIVDTIMHARKKIRKTNRFMGNLLDKPMI